MINRLAILMVVSCLGWHVAMVSSARGGKAEDSDLERKADWFQKIVETEALQQHAMVPMFVRASDYQLPSAEDYRGAYRHRHLLGKSEAEVGLPPMHVWRAWEDTSSNTAYYLHAMSYRYRTTGEPEALAICRRALGALKYIHSLAVERGERGFLCKPYGGTFSKQTAPDQLQCVAWGLAAYRPIAPPDDLAAIDRMTLDFARYAIKTNYTSPHGYFGRSVNDLRQEPKAAKTDWRKAVLFLPVMNLAWQGSGDPEIAAEIRRLYAEAGEKNDFVVKTDRFSSNAFSPSRRHLYLPALLMDYDPAHDTVWRQAMLTNYRLARTGMLEDGTMLTAWSYDRKQGGRTIEPMPTVGGGVGRTGRSAIFALGFVAAQRWLPEEEMKEEARKILERLDEGELRFILPLDDEHSLPAEWQVESKMLDLDSLTSWLCAYWEGRYRGYW